MRWSATTRSTSASNGSTDILHAPLNDETVQESARLKEDATLARDLGFDAEYVETVPLVNRPGIRFAGQARIHPRAYLAGIAKAFVALGGRIYEHSAADEFSTIRAP